jgi:hypothetical protein
MDDIFFLEMELQDRAFVWRGDLDDGFIGFHFGQSLVNLDIFAFLNTPFDDFTLGYPFSDVWKLELISHDHHSMIFFM